MKNIFPAQVCRLLMVDPEFFDIKYAINPFMKTADGKLKTVDRPLAREQWLELKSVFENLGLQVEMMKGEPDLPDMVFCANQCFPFIYNNRPTVVLGNMKSSQRSPEVQHFSGYFFRKGWDIFSLDLGSSSFEANGDLIPVPGSEIFFGGVGPRTSSQAYTQLRERFDLRIVSLELIHPQFYHLDTCFFVLHKDACAFVPEAFSDDDAKKIRDNFNLALEIPLDEGLKFFAGNAFCPDGKNVVMQKGATQTANLLKHEGFSVIPVETSEFIKAGGSVFCLKLALPF